MFTIASSIHSEKAMQTWKPIIIIHTIIAIVAMSLGAFIFTRRKGSAAHKLFGRLWVALMLGIYFGALVVTGLFTLMPHRLIGRMLWT
jgi:uncharacterized membrane protein